MAKPYDDQTGLNDRHNASLIESTIQPGQAVQAVSGPTGGAVPVFLSGASTILVPFSRQVVVAVPTTPVPLTPATSQQDQVEIIANITNTGNIYLGSATVSSASGMVMEPGRSIKLQNVDLNLIFIDADVGGEGVSYFALT